MHCESVSDGLSVSDSPRLVVDSNILTDCYAGFTIDNSINITVEQNTISGTSTYGMNLNNLDSPEIRNNIIQDAYHMGINIDLVWEGVFENNHLTNCGIFFQHGYILLFYNQTMIGNTVNSKPIYYGLSANNNNLNLNGDNYGQIILANCSFVDISSGEFVRASSAIQLHLSDEIMIDQVVARYNSRAFIISWSDNVTITDCVIEGQFDYNGIYVSDSVRVRIEGCTITRHTGTDRIGIYVYDSDFNEIIDCDLSNNYDGVYVSQSLNSSISDCDILNSEIYALRVGGFSMNYPIIEGNTILNSTYGVYVDDGDDGIIRNNLIMYSSLYGIYLTGSNNNYNVTLNTVENNRDGIFVAQGDWQ
ncbi:MAG: right-handed parallel beta-helix repeat-containing protein, partial [Candidatus Thorarchaeota archaeon]